MHQVRFLLYNGTHSVVDALETAVGVPADGEAVLTDDELVDVDHEADEALQDHRGEQIHVDPSHLVLAKFPMETVSSSGYLPHVM